MFNLALNIIFILWYSIFTIILTIITGRLPKISPYHLINHYDYTAIDLIKSTYLDRYRKVDALDLVSDATKKRIIDNFIHDISKDRIIHPCLLENSIPIYEGNKSIGNMSYVSALKEFNEKNKPM